MNYRKIYTLNTSKEVPKDFHVHHIDFDRSNNDIHNLVALPKKLHSQYHYYLNKINGVNSDFRISNDYHTLNYIDDIESLICIHQECMKWMYYRDYLRGVLPKMTNLSYEVYAANKPKKDN